jgi:hypothetical protein
LGRKGLKGLASCSSQLQPRKLTLGVRSRSLFLVGCGAGKLRLPGWLAPHATGRCRYKRTGADAEAQGAAWLQQPALCSPRRAAPLLPLVTVRVRLREQAALLPINLRQHSAMLLTLRRGRMTRQCSPLSHCTLPLQPCARSPPRNMKLWSGEPVERWVLLNSIVIGCCGRYG